MDKMSTAFCESLYLHVSVYLDASVLDILWGKKKSNIVSYEKPRLKHYSENQS